VSLDFLAGPARQAAVVGDTAHRPWPLPDEPWTTAQTWVDLAFLHWRVDPGELGKHLPDSVELETFDGAAWLGVVPFLMTGVRLRGLPPFPVLSSFPELNVRTYVRRDDRPGVWFFSLDADSRLFVEAAKWQYKLPYHHAEMSHGRVGDDVHYESARPGGVFNADYRGTGDLFEAEPGSLEHFLTERYCLYTADGPRAYRAEIHHLPWTLQRGVAEIDLNTMAPLTLPDEAPHVLFAPRQDVVVWPLEQL
jgi:hypothetical protein